MMAKTLRGTSGKFRPPSLSALPPFPTCRASFASAPRGNGVTLYLGGALGGAHTTTDELRYWHACSDVFPYDTFSIRVS